MNRMIVSIVICGVAGLVCGCDSQSDLREAPKHSCLARAGILQGYFKEIPGGWVEYTDKLKALLPPEDVQGGDDSNAQGNEVDQEAEAQDASIRFVSTGEFVVEWGQWKVLPVPFVVTCTGDINKKRFTSVQINGTIYRPRSGESWSTERPII